MVKDVVIKELEPIREDSTILFGLPDTGLVGVISSNQIMENKKMHYIGSIDSVFFPPMIIIHKGDIMPPTRIYGADGKVYAVVSEIALPANGINRIVDSIVEWLVEKKPKLIVFLGGVPVPNRINIEQPKCYGVPVNAREIELLNTQGIPLLEEGVMVGPYALMLKACKEKNLPALALLSESYANYPDPGAAASAISALNKLVGLNVDIKPLEERAEEIRIKMRDLMRRTNKEMQQVEKSREYELPPLYM